MPDESGDPRPVYTVVAGPSGSGKTTLTEKLQAEGELPACLNPDAVAAGLPPETANRAQIARQLTVQETSALLAGRESFARESAFSGQSIMRSLEEARASGFRIEVVFVAVGGVDEAIERVSARERRGGHGIPEAEQRRRFDLTMQNAAAAARVADRMVVWENPHGRALRAVAQVDRGVVVVLRKNRPPWVDGVVEGLERAPGAEQKTGQARRSVPPVRFKRDKGAEPDR